MFTYFTGCMYIQIYCINLEIVDKNYHGRITETEKLSQVELQNAIMHVQDIHQSLFQIDYHQSNG